MQHGVAAELLARSAMFHGLRDALLVQIVDRCELRQFGAGQALSYADTPADGALLIIEGDVTLHDADGQPLGLTQGRGTLINEMAMFVPTEHFSGAVAASSVWALDMPRHVIAQLLVEQPELAAHFTRNTRQSLVHIADTLRRLDGMLMESANVLDTIPMQDVVEPAETAEPELPATLENGDTPRGMLGQRFAQALNGGETNGSVNGHSDAAKEASNGSAAPAQRADDLIAQLNAALGEGSRNSPAPVHDLTVSPSPASHPRPAWSSQHLADQDSPRHGLAADPGSMPASPGPDNSTT